VCGADFYRFDRRRDTGLATFRRKNRGRLPSDARGAVSAAFCTNVPGLAQGGVRGLSRFCNVFHKNRALSLDRLFVFDYLNLYER
jgi:hypothetical protein